MANYSEGPISITIRIEDTFVVEISNGESTWNLMTEIKTTNCSDVVELYLQRMYEDLAGSFKWADSFQWLKAGNMEISVFIGQARSRSCIFHLFSR